MPKSDTWPGGVGLDMMTGMDSAGSCDSVVSANSGFSDDSLEYLSAEERACLMFLEETIESLDTEEDSGLSNDEPDQLPSPGNLANKLADLSASMSKNKLNDPQRHESEEIIEENADSKLKHRYLVPTPLVVASSTSCSPPATKPGTSSDKTHWSKTHFTPSGKKHSQKHNPSPAAAPPVPLVVNVVISPSIKPGDNSVRTAEGPLPRGPLSYDALVHLRRSASAKKTPLCPTVDHTIESDEHRAATVGGPNRRNLPRSDKSRLESSNPPVVAPKPKNIPVHISVMTQNESSVVSDSSYNVKRAADPQMVRLEALQKLGLLKEQQVNNNTVTSVSPPKSHPSLDPMMRFPRAQTNVNPPGSLSFCHSHVPAEPKNKPLQSSASFHHNSRRDQQSASVSHPVQSNSPRPAGLGRSSSSAQPVQHKPSNSVGYTVTVVPGMGADRKEALRKLGLLKD